MRDDYAFFSRVEQFGTGCRQGANSSRVVAQEAGLTSMFATIHAADGAILPALLSQGDI